MEYTINSDRLELGLSEEIEGSEPSPAKAETKTESKGFGKKK